MGRSQHLLMERQGYNSTGARRPKQNAVPTVAGTNTVGQTLTGTNGTFTGDGTIVITRQWTRNGKNINGATAATYVLAGADSGKTIRFMNIARSQYGEAVSSSVSRTIA